MDLRFVEAGHSEPGNWGKFAIGRYTAADLAEPTRFPGCEGKRLVSVHGNGANQIWVMDLATGEGARFDIQYVGPADAATALKVHKVWVCPLFEPFIVWLFGYISTHYDSWWGNLPRTIELDDAPFALAGYRRRGRQQPEGLT